MPNSGPLLFMNLRNKRELVCLLPKFLVADVFGPPDSDDSV